MAEAANDARSGVPSLAADVARTVLAPPWLPPSAADTAPLATDAAAIALPVRLAAPAGAPRLLLARALHALGGRIGPLLAVSGPASVAGGLPPGATLYVDVAALDAATTAALEAIIDDGAAWVLAAVDPQATLPAALAARLAAIVLDVPPLAARTAELPALAAALLGRLAARRAAAAPTLSQAAIAWLAARPWPGDVAQLEGALGRALLVAGGAAVLDVEHLAGRPPAARAATTARQQTPAAPEAATAGRAGHDAAALELLLAEMAHELKNPLVTVKTFAEHLPEMLADPVLRERFAALAADAVARMDGVLENLLAYARLGAPRPAPVAVGALLERIVAEAAPALAERRVTVRRGSDDARCTADPEHLAYALRNLVEGIVREVPARGEVLVDASANGVVRVGFATANGIGARLRRLAMGDGPPDVADPTLLPLPFTLARAALARGGGSLAVEPEDGGRTTLVVRLPPAGAGANG